jgi:hypothetical protein
MRAPLRKDTRKLRLYDEWPLSFILHVRGQGRRALEEFVDDEGRPSLRLTPRGAAIGRRLAMAGEEHEAQAVLDALQEAEAPFDGPHAGRGMPSG